MAKNFSLQFLPQATITRTLSHLKLHVNLANSIATGYNYVCKKNSSFFISQNTHFQRSIFWRVCLIGVSLFTGLDYWTQNLTTKSHFPAVTTTKIYCQSSSKAAPLAARAIFHWGIWTFVYSGHWVQYRASLWLSTGEVAL